MKNSFKYIIVGVLIAILLFLNPFLRRKFEKQTYYIRDTSLNVTARRELKNDTVIKVYERIIYRRAKPEVVYVDRVDSSFAEKLYQMDLMMRLEKKRNTLKVTALNQRDSTIKEFRFNNVLNNFVVTSMKGDIFVKSSNIVWEGVEAGVELRNKILSERKMEAGVYMMSKFRFFDKVGIGGFLSYWLTGENSNQTEIGININYKLK